MTKALFRSCSRTRVADSSLWEIDRREFLVVTIREQDDKLQGSLVENPGLRTPWMALNSITFIVELTRLSLGAEQRKEPTNHGGVTYLLLIPLNLVQSRVWRRCISFSASHQKGPDVFLPSFFRLSHSPMRKQKCPNRVSNEFDQRSECYDTSWDSWDRYVRLNDERTDGNG